MSATRDCWQEVESTHCTDRGQCGVKEIPSICDMVPTAAPLALVVSVFGGKKLSRTEYRKFENLTNFKFYHHFETFL